VTTRSPTSEPTQALHANNNPTLSTPSATTTTTVETNGNDGGSSSSSSSSSSSDALAASFGTVIVAAAAALFLLGASVCAVYRWQKMRNLSAVSSTVDSFKEVEQIRRGGRESSKLATVEGGSDEASEVLRLKLAERKAEAAVGAGEKYGTSWSSREEPCPSSSSRGAISTGACSAQQQPPPFAPPASPSTSSTLRAQSPPLSQRRRGQSNKQRAVL